jgi:hypothetical protein
MKDTTKRTIMDTSLLPADTGFKDNVTTLCIGLDFAWFGGSSNDATSQYDFLAAVLIGPDRTDSQLKCDRIPLLNRDPSAEATSAAVKRLVDGYEGDAKRIVIAIDAPLQTNRQLPERTPLPKKGSVQRRACDTHLSDRRKRIDKFYGGAAGWHPNVQPGAPLPRRLQILLKSLSSLYEIKPWTAMTSQINKLAIECFPAEAIWAVKRLNQFPEKFTAPVVKAYKDQSGSRLTATQVRDLVETVLLEGFKVPSGAPDVWPRLVEDVLAWMQNDQKWRVGNFYRGGKMLDDVVDSMICLATAISYAKNSAHVWQDAKQTDDGHIIGPGRFAQVPVT